MDELHSLLTVVSALTEQDLRILFTVFFFAAIINALMFYVFEMILRVIFLLLLLIDTQFHSVISRHDSYYRWLFTAFKSKRSNKVTEK